ncbi:transposase [Azospirillaceae bacterium]
MKEWWTPREAAAAGLPGLPGTKAGVQALADRQAWDADPTRCRDRMGRGGGREYHYTLFPEPARLELAARAAAEEARRWAAARLPVPVAAGAKLPAVMPARPAPALTEVGQARAGAKLAVLAAAHRFVAARRGELGRTAALRLFAGMWSAGQIEADPWVHEQLPTVSVRSLLRWEEAREADQATALAGRYGNRRDCGVWNTCLAYVRDFTIAVFATRPHLTAEQVRRLTRAEFCDPERPEDAVMVIVEGWSMAVPLPSLRSFQQLLARWKVENAALVELLKSPDDWRNRRMLALGDDVSHITRPNEQWLIDASPQDLLLTDGRHSIYLLIDVWSRRILILVTKTPRTEALKLLVRRALLAWGVPEEVKTDNGSDFTSREAARVAPRPCCGPTCRR